MINMYKALYVFDSHITGIYDFSITVYDEDTVKDALMTSYNTIVYVNTKNGIHTTRQNLPILMVCCLELRWVIYLDFMMIIMAETLKVHWLDLH